MGLFNVRVYGLLVENERILVSDEYENETFFTKLPGGGLEYGEGLVDGLKREFKEECDLEIEVTRHFYTTDFFVKSIFNETQVISIYYVVKALNKPSFRVSEVGKVFDFQNLDTSAGSTAQAFRWVPVKTMNALEMTFPTEQHVIKLLHKQPEHLCV